jgi:serine protease Do
MQLHISQKYLSGIAVLLSCFLSAAVVHAQPDEDQAVWAGTILAPKAFRAAADKISPSLVTIESFAGTGATQGRIGGIRRQGEGNTTGLVISADGYIVTSTFNFIQNPTTIAVVTSDGKRHYAELLGKDETRQICVLKIKDVDNLVVPEMLSPDEVEIGQWAISVGVGYGDERPAISAGIVSARNRINGRAIQTDANISPANYGGPLIDIEGRVIGICCPLSPNSEGPAGGVEWYDSGIGFAIPLRGSEHVLAKLKAGESIRPAWLGVSITAVEGAGITVNKVVKGAPADQAGIKTGDRIDDINGRPTPDMNALRQVIQQMSEGDSAKITITREGKSETLEVTFTARPTGSEADAADEEPKSDEQDNESPQEPAPQPESKDAQNGESQNGEPQNGESPDGSAPPKVKPEETRPEQEKS